MLARYRYKNLTWIDLESPTREEVQQVMDEFSIEPLIAEELLLPSSKSRTEARDAYLYLVLHFPALRHTHKSREQELDFIIGREFLITTRYDTIDPLHKFSKIFEVNSILDKGNIGEHAGFLFAYMVKKLYKSIEHELEFLRHNLSTIEEHIFSGEEVGMVSAISRTARDLLNLRQTIEPHRDILHSFEETGARFFGDEFSPYLRALSNEYFRIHNHVMRLTETLHELRETNNSLLTTKQNETMRVLTIMALLTFPLSLFVAILSTDTIHNPIRGLPYDFWVIVVLVVLMGAAMLAYFKHKKWL